jgi:hypothetical protein
MLTELRADRSASPGGAPTLERCHEQVAAAWRAAALSTRVDEPARQSMQYDRQIPAAKANSADGRQGPPHFVPGTFVYGRHVGGADPLMTFGTQERGPMRISTDPTSGLSVAQRRVLEAFYAGALTAGNLMEELRRAAAAVPSNPPQASVSEAPPEVGR